MRPPHELARRRFRGRLGVCRQPTSAFGGASAPRARLRAAAGRHGQPGARLGRSGASVPPPCRTPSRPVLPAAVRRALPRPAHVADDEADQLGSAETQRDESLVLAEERLQPNEERDVQEIIDTFTAQLRGRGSPATSSAVATPRPTASCGPSSLSVTDLPEHLARHLRGAAHLSRLGLLLRAGTVRHPRYRRRWVHEHEHQTPWGAWPKLLDDERFTQDLLGVSTPTFVTPDTRSNTQLQLWSLKNASPFYFMNLHD